MPKREDVTDDIHISHTLGTREGYDRWSGSYDGDGNPLIAVEEPVFERMLGNIEGLDVLDVGCGTGRHTLPMAEKARHVTAVDFSSGMLDAARRKWHSSAVGDRAHLADRIVFLECDLTKPLPESRLPTADGRYDRVVCALVLDHIHHLTPYFEELANRCRPDGHIVMTVMHPAMSLKGVRARFIDDKNQSRIEIESATHRISDYVMAALEAGLQISGMEEHVVSESVAACHPRGRKHLGWPILLAMQLRHGSA